MNNFRKFEKITILTRSLKKIGHNINSLEKYVKIILLRWIHSILHPIINNCIISKQFVQIFYGNVCARWAYSRSGLWNKKGKYQPKVNMYILWLTCPKQTSLEAVYMGRACPHIRACWNSIDTSIVNVTICSLLRACAVLLCSLL